MVNSFSPRSGWRKGKRSPRAASLRPLPMTSTLCPYFHHPPTMPHHAVIPIGPAIAVSLIPSYPLNVHPFVPIWPVWQSILPHHTPCASHTSLPCPWMQIHHNSSRCATTHAQFVRCEPRFDSAHCIISEMTKKIIQCTAGSWRWIESNSLSTQINPEHKLGNSLHLLSSLYLNITECTLFTSLYNVCAVVHCAHFKDVFLEKQLVSDRKNTLSSPPAHFTQGQNDIGKEKSWHCQNLNLVSQWKLFSLKTSKLWLLTKSAIEPKTCLLKQNHPQPSLNSNEI